MFPIMDVRGEANPSSKEAITIGDMRFSQRSRNIGF